MIHKTPSSRAQHVHVVFELPASLWADRIYLVGDFNQWDTATTPLQRDRQGMWRTELDLPTDQHYRFYYLVDGHRRTDFYADSWTSDAPGAQHSVIIAKLPQPYRGTPQ